MDDTRYSYAYKQLRAENPRYRALVRLEMCLDESPLATTKRVTKPVENLNSLNTSGCIQLISRQSVDLSLTPLSSHGEVGAADAHQVVAHIDLEVAPAPEKLVEFSPPVAANADSSIDNEDRGIADKDRCATPPPLCLAVVGSQAGLDKKVSVLPLSWHGGVVVGLASFCCVVLAALMSVYLLCFRVQSSRQVV